MQKERDNEGDFQMLRIFLAIFGVMFLMCAGGAVFAKHEMHFKTSAAFDQSDKAAMLMAQNNGEGNRQQRCRRDRPPLSS